ncbi:LacI family DNA-binding transcriptional regulator [Bradyrhizobium sp.]|uniref:LacI family DNA-binding transcriptional regulator n=1 Tax=Bradyrhizobium sp. TaxID=376 RepID=UPI0039E612AD
MNDMRSARRVSIRDVAEAAGVSITTVSHVLNEKGRASEETKKLVLEAVERVGYRPDPAARSLRTGDTGVLGIVFRPSDAISGSMNGTEFHIRVAGGAATAAISHGYGLLHMPSPLATARRAFPIDGCIVVSPTKQDPVLTELLKRKIPVVTIDPEHGSNRTSGLVARDDVSGMRALLDHLESTGARRLLFLSGKDRNSWLVESEEAFKAWAQSHGIAAVIEHVSETSGAEGAREQAVAALRTKPRPDAIVAATSRFATGIIDAARSLGIAVPSELRVAALSDSELARGHETPITALDLHGDRAGRDGVEVLIALLQGKVPVEHAAVIPSLRIRASTLRRDAAG